LRVSDSFPSLTSLISNITGDIVEDPFTKLETLIPDPPITAPQVTPLVPPTALSEPSQITLPAPSSLFITDDTHSLSSIVPPPPAPPADGTTKRRKYFTINRFVPARGAAPKPAGDTASPAPSQVEWQTPRTAHPTDYGIYASLMGRLASESRVTLAHAASALGTEERLFAFLRASMDIEPPLRSSSSKAAATSPTEESSTPPAPEDEAAAYFTGSRAREGAAYIRDIVYGGFDGLAYARSVAQFVDGSNTPHEGGPTTEPHPLGASLAQWAFENVVDPLTSGRLRLLRDTAHALLYPESKANPLSSTWQAQIVESSAEYPHRAVLLGALKAVLADKIDAAALVRSPEELLRSVGVGGKRKRDPSEDVGSRKKPKEEGGPGEDVADTKTVLEEVPDFDLSTFAAVQVALRKTGDALLRLDRQQREEQKVKSEEDSARIEDPAARTVRLQLLNIVKAVPVDFIGTNGLVIPAS
jgi:bromodomain-containing protein 7